MSNEQPKKLFLLDAFALIFRAHFAFSNNPRINSKGLNTSVMFGFTNSLLEILIKQKPSHIAVVFDTSAPTFRHKEYEEYKANRQETPEDIKIATPYVKEIVRGFNIPVIELDGFEADDLIGTLAKKASKKGFEVFMMTPDKDFGQLVEENIFLYKPAYMGNAVDIMGPKEIMEKWDITNVDQVRDILGLQGDASDNIPGVPGIGPKTAAKLLHAYGSVENILEHVHELKGKQKQTFEEFGQQGLLSKHLATIVIDAPVEFNEKDLSYSGPDKKKLLPLLQELEFRTMVKRIFDTAPVETTESQLDMFGGSSSTKASPNTASTFTEEENSEETILSQAADYQSRTLEIEDLDEVISLNKSLIKSKAFSIETVTDHVNPVNAKLLGLSISFKEKQSYYIDFADLSIQETTSLLQALSPAFQHQEVIKIGHNIKYEIVMFMRHGIELSGPLFDVMLAHYLIDADSNHRLDLLSEIYLKYQLLPDQMKFLDKTKRDHKSGQLTFEQRVGFAGESSEVMFRLHEVLNKLLDTQQLKSLFYDMEIPLIPVLAKMESIGVAVDVSELNEMSAEVGDLCKTLESNIFSEAGEEFNVNSPKQLGEILFEKLHLLEKPKKTKTGQYATGEEVLKTLEHHKIVQDILEYRELQKLKSTYIDALPAMISESDGRIHTNYSQAVAATGRLSSVNPNLQNIPVRTERGRLIRKAFICNDPDFTLLSADYSQIELRIMASFSEDPHMIEAFKQGRDIHATTASRIFSVPLEEVDDQMRRKAKSVNFGLIYGQSAFGLAQNLNISRGEAKEIIDAYFKEFGAVKAYMDDVINDAREKEYVETILGRRRFLRDINSKNQTMRGFAERNAINAPIQGSAADIIKIAMIKIHDFMESKNLKSKMIMQVHDELVFEVHKDEQTIMQEEIPKMMSEAVKLSVPMVVDWGVGENWLEAH